MNTLNMLLAGDLRTAQTAVVFSLLDWSLSCSDIGINSKSHGFLEMLAGTATAHDQSKAAEVAKLSK